MENLNMLYTVRDGLDGSSFSIDRIEHVKSSNKAVSFFNDVSAKIENKKHCSNRDELKTAIQAIRAGAREKIPCYCIRSRLPFKVYRFFFAFHSFDCAILISIATILRSNWWPSACFSSFRRVL